MAHQELIGHLRVDQLDIYPTLHRTRDGRHQRVVRDKIRITDDHRFLRCVDQGSKQLQVVLVLEARAAREHLAEDIASRHRYQGGFRRGVVVEQNTGLRVPIRAESGIELGDNRSRDLRNQLIIGDGILAEVIAFDYVL